MVYLDSVNVESCSAKVLLVHVLFILLFEQYLEDPRALENS